MAFSWQESVKPAGTRDIQCDIEYLDKSYIHVYLDGAETTAFTWTSSTNIRLNSPLSAETAVLLIRKTEREYLYIEFASGAPFIEVNVDTQNTQFLHLAQELVEGRSIEGFYGDINMHRYRITNLGDPVDARDAANKQYVDAGDARLDQRIDAEHAAWVAAVANEASIRKAADDALDVRTTNLEQTYFNANTNSFPWWTVLTTDTDTVTPGMPFTKAKVRVNGVTQTAGYSYTVTAGVVKFAEVLPAGTLVDMTIGIDTEADTSAVSSVLELLTAPSGASLISSGNAPVSVLLRRSIFEFMSAGDRTLITSTTGVEVLVDYALAAAVAAGVTELYFPPAPGIYVVGQTPVTLPAGFSITGVAAKPYTASSNASFNSRGTVIRLASGATAPFILTSRHRFLNVILDGRNSSVNLMKGVGSDQTQYCRFDSCGIYRWLNGIGGSSSSGYTATVQVIGCAIASNYRGVRNVIDSRFTDCTINANTYNGVELNAGANNNSFLNVRNEWNGAHNYFASGAKRNVVCGELCDRAGLSGFVAVNGGQWVVCGVTVQRSGKNAVVGSVDDAHFQLAGGSSSIIINGVDTLAGANDDGSGTSTPSCTLSTSGANSDEKTFIATGSRLGGFTGTSWLRSGVVKNLSVLGCAGIPDVKNFGFSQSEDGATRLGDKVSSLALSGAGSTATLTFTVSSDGARAQYSEPLVRKLEITARNNTDTGSVSRFYADLIISRELATATVVVDASSVKTHSTLSGGTWGLASASPTGVSVTPTISADGSTLTVTLTAVDNAPRRIWAQLRG